MQNRWWVDLVERLRRARSPAEVNAVIDSLEDQYDVFSGPGRVRR